MSILIVAEKPAVARAINVVVGANNRKDGYYEGNGYIVTWCEGHLAGLKAPDDYCEEWSNTKRSFEQLPMIPDNYELKVSEGKSKQFNVIKKLMRSDEVESIICGTDADREGECIFRYVYTLAGCRKPVMRLWVSSLEEYAISEAMKCMKPSSDYDLLFEAGYSRAKADWLIGMNASRLFSCRYRSPLNIGRVKTPTLAMIVKRDYEIKNFVKQKYFTVELDCGKFTASSERIDDEAQADRISWECCGKTATVTDVKREIKTVNPPKLFDLTTLQREANKKFGYTAQQTLDYTQSLYEGKIVTYPRTDSQFVTESERNTIENVLHTFPMMYGIETAENIDRVINDAKVSGHHAIIPTERIGSEDFNIDSLPQGERNILTLICVRLAMAVSDPHKYEAVTVQVNCEDNMFTVKGKTITENGWKEHERLIKNTDKDETENEKALPEISQGDIYEEVSANKAEHWTSPPKPYTEDTLLSAMEHAGQEFYDDDTEKKGIGTPATRAKTIEELIRNTYIVRDKKYLHATQKGIDLIEVVPEEVKSAKLTAEWEMRFTHIQSGDDTANSFMSDITDYVEKLCSDYSTVDESKSITAHTVVGKCPRCGKNVLEGKLNFYCESGKDGCDFSIWKEMKVPATKVSAKQAQELLEKGQSRFKAVSKTGKEYTANFKLEDTGKYVNLVLIEDKPVGKCPKCGAEVKKGQFGWHCTKKCGMNLAKVYGKVLTDNQLANLLSGKEVIFTVNEKKTTVLPDVEENNYQGKTYYQWKVKRNER